MVSKAAGKGPLYGIRIVDLTAMVMGPYATQIMADMGAEVIKIEPPEGDPTRYISVAPEHGLSGVFVNVNRGKKSVVLNLRDDADKAKLNALIATADVFIHSMRGAAIARLGYDYAAVKAIKPDVIYTNCYGYSRRGPDGDLPAYDDTIQAECGIPAVQKMLTGQASFAGTIIADKVAGLTVLYSTMMALFSRERTGEGQEVEVGMFETMASFMLVEHANGMLFDPPLGAAHYPRAVAPNRRPYKTKDGEIAALVYNDGHWKRFVEAVQPAWADERFDSLAKRAARIDEVYGLLGETFLERTSEEWLTLLREINVPAAPLRTPDELFENAHLKEIGFFEEVDSDYGKLNFPGVPTWFSATPGHVQGPCPRLGADNEAVFAALDASSR